MKLIRTLLLLATAWSLVGCLPNTDQNLQGQIQGMDFSFVSGYAATNFFDDAFWIVVLHKISPEPGMEPWEAGAYPSSYPYLSFALEKSSGPRTYAVTTFGSSSGGNPGLVLVGSSGPTGGVFFDEGTLEITAITADTITGNIVASTFEAGSELLGTFSVPIDPASH